MSGTLDDWTRTYIQLSTLVPQTKSRTSVRAVSIETSQYRFSPWVRPRAIHEMVRSLVVFPLPGYQMTLLLLCRSPHSKYPHNGRGFNLGFPTSLDSGVEQFRTRY